MDELIALNEAEIRDYRWVDVSLFFEGKIENLRYWTYTNEKIGKDVDKFFLECPSYPIGMDRDLWGLTMMIIHKFLIQVISSNLSIPSKMNHSFVE